MLQMLKTNSDIATEIKNNYNGIAVHSIGSGYFANSVIEAAPIVTAVEF